MKTDFDVLLDIKHSIILVCVVAFIKLQIWEDAIHGAVTALSGAITSWLIFLVRKTFKKHRTNKTNSEAENDE